jgi:hypothetical protein
VDRPEPTTSSQFEPGQVWRYKNRPGEEASRVIIGKIDRWPTSGTIVHVKLTGLQIASGIPHAPVDEDHLSGSVTDLTSEAADLDGFEKGYEVWRAARGGIWAIPLAEIVEIVEEGLKASQRDLQV